MDFQVNQVKQSDRVVLKVWTSPVMSAEQMSDFGQGWERGSGRSNGGGNG